MPTDSHDDVIEFDKLVARCEGFLHLAAVTVDGILERREEALNRREKAEARLRRAREQLICIERENLGKWNEDVAREAETNARREIDSINKYLAGPDFDIEYEKAFARQLAALLREDCTRRLDEIAARSDDPALQRKLAEYKDKIFVSVDELLKDFKEAAPLQPSEVRQARAEAERFLRRKDLPFL